MAEKAGKGKPKVGKKRPQPASADASAPAPRKRGRPKLEILLDPDGRPETEDERKRRLARERQKRKQDRSRVAVSEVQVLRRRLRETEILRDAILDALAKATEMGKLPKHALAAALRNADAAVLKSDRKLGITARGMTERLVDHVADIVAGLDNPSGTAFFTPPDLDELDEITGQDLQDAFHPKFEGHVPNDGPPDGIRFVSLFSGIGGADLAFMRRGWHAIAHAEMAKFACVVLKDRFPTVPNLGDVTAVDWRAWAAENGPVDLLVGGAPCQAFSMAGRRLGVDDPRGNLTLEFLRIAREVGADWFVYENVPGLLKSPKGDAGRDFGLMLAAVREAGYSACWTILDTQNFGVPQRRRRLYMVGCRGDWRPGVHALLGDVPMQWPGEALEAAVARGRPPESEDAAKKRRKRRPVEFDDVEDAVRTGFKKWPNAGVLAGGHLTVHEVPEWRDDFGQGNPLWWGLDVVEEPGLVMSDVGLKGVLSIQKGESARMQRLYDAIGVATGELPYIPPSDPPVFRAVEGGGITSDETPRYLPDVAATLTRSQSLRKGSAADLLVGTEGGKLRVLGPGERERLQGFPTGWTEVQWPNGKWAGRTPRYQAIGNAMTVDILGHIAARLEPIIRQRREEEADRHMVAVLRDEMLRERKERGK